MASDKRSVSTDALETLGTIIGEGAGRDAIHLAVEPVIAGCQLYPGQAIGLSPDGKALPVTLSKGLGIVDPFLPHVVQKGERFWLVVYPRQITSLRHVWTHPDFGDAPSNPASKALSEEWMRRFVATLGGPSYEDVISVASYGGDDGYLCFGEEFDGPRDIPTEFWDHMEVITGKKVTNRAHSFRCAC